MNQAIRTSNADAMLHTAIHRVDRRDNQECENCETKNQSWRSSNLMPQSMQKAHPGWLRVLLRSWSTYTSLWKNTRAAIRTDKDRILRFGVFLDGLVNLITADTKTDSPLAHTTKWSFGNRCSFGLCHGRRAGLLRES